MVGVLSDSADLAVPLYRDPSSRDAPSGDVPTPSDTLDLFCTERKESHCLDTVKTGSRFDFTISISRGRLSDAKILASHEMGADIPPDFDAAVARFRAFLKLNSYSGNIVWVTPEDVLLTGKRFLYLRVPISADNETQMRRMYKQGVTQGRGLVMGTVCGMNRSTYCYLWFPKSVEEIPQGIWPTAGSLKLSATDKSSSRDGRPINNKMLWALLKLWHRKKQGLRDLLFSEKGLIVEVRQ